MSTTPATDAQSAPGGTGGISPHNLSPVEIGVVVGMVCAFFGIMAAVFWTRKADMRRKLAAQQQARDNDLGAVEEASVSGRRAHVEEIELDRKQDDPKPGSNSASSNDSTTALHLAPVPTPVPAPAAPAPSPASSAPPVVAARSAPNRARLWPSPSTASDVGSTVTSVAPVQRTLYCEGEPPEILASNRKKTWWGGIDWREVRPVTRADVNRRARASDERQN